LALGLGALSLAFTAVSAVVPIVVTAVGGLITTLSGLLSGILLLANPVALFTAGLAALTTAAGVLVGGLKAVAVGLAALLGPIGLVSAGIVAISTILYASNKDFRNWFNNVAGILGDRLYTFLVGASVMFGRFAKEVGNALGRVGQSLADFFSTKILPVLGGVVSGLVKMFEAFFKWVFHGFSAVAEKVIELYQALPEQIRALLGQVGRFTVDVFENLPVFRRTQQLINSISGFISEAMRIGGDVRRQWALDEDRRRMSEIPRPTPLKEITIPEQQATSSSIAKPATTTKPSPQTDAAKKAQEATKIRDQILQLQDTILNKTKESYQTIQAEIVQLQDTIKQTVAPFNAFNTSTQKFLNTVSADLPFPTKAQEITNKYNAVLKNFETVLALITQETGKRVTELHPSSLPEWKNLPDPTNPQDQITRNYESIFNASMDVTKALTEVDNLKKTLELVKSIMPEVQKDVEDMLKPQQEQLRTATANLDVIRRTNNFLAQGVAPEQARINALAQIEKEQRQQSLDALKAMVGPLKRSLDLAKILGNKDASATLSETIKTLELYIEQWNTVNGKIDQHNQKIADAEKRNQQLTERRERNLQIAGSIASSIGDGLTDVFDLLLNKTNDWGAALQDIASNVLRQIANQLFQIMVITPIVKAMTAGLGSMFGVSFADGGIMTSRGPVELKTYASGGIANSPQLALFGEGRMPEAYVPLPDGRRIPVAMESGGSGGGNFTVNVNVDASGSQVSGSPSQGEQLGRAIAQAVQSEIIKQQRPGGLLYT